MTDQLDLEHKQIAALLAMDIDILATVAKSGQWTKEDLQAHINLLKEKKDKLIADPDYRQTRYSATSLVFNIASRS